MENENFLAKFADKIGQNTSVKNVFGEPIQVGEKTIIPVAQIALGVGGGYGQMGKKNKKAPYSDSSETSSKDMQEDNEGAGGGVGMYAKAKGIYEITPTSTRFIPLQNMTQLLTSVAIGFLVSRWFFPRRVKAKN